MNWWRTSLAQCLLGWSPAPPVPLTSGRSTGSNPRSIRNPSLKTPLIWSSAGRRGNFVISFQFLPPSSDLSLSCPLSLHHVDICVPAVEISPRLSHSCIRRADTSQLISIYCPCVSVCVSVCAPVFSASIMQSSVACGNVLFAPPHTIFHMYSSPSITVRNQKQGPPSPSFLHLGPIPSASTSVAFAQQGNFVPGRIFCSS